MIFILVGNIYQWYDFLFANIYTNIVVEYYFALLF